MISSFNPIKTLAKPRLTEEATDKQVFYDTNIMLFDVIDQPYSMNHFLTEFILGHFHCTVNSPSGSTLPLD